MAWMPLAVPLAVGAALLGLAGSVMAAEPIKIGFITTLSGPAGYIGEDIRDGFRLAIEDGKLGGSAVQLLVEDDAANPGNAKRIADRFLKSEKVKLTTGLVFTHVTEAVVPDILEAGGFYIGTNAGPSSFAGARCHQNYFVATWQAEALHEAGGHVANSLNYKKIYIVVPNYQAGKDAISGFKRGYKGEIIGEIYTKLDQTDYASELARIRAANPDAVWFLMPGGLGINFLKQFALAGLKIPLVTSAPPMDIRVAGAAGEAAAGIHVSANWASDFANPTSRKFVSDFVSAYKREPTPYAAQGYDAALLLASAIKAVGGDLSKEDAFRKALQNADFISVRGRLKFARNHHPVQDMFAAEVTRDGTGKPGIRSGKVVLSNHTDPYAKDCKL